METTTTPITAPMRKASASTPSGTSSLVACQTPTAIEAKVAATANHPTIVPHRWRSRIATSAVTPKTTIPKPVTASHGPVARNASTSGSAPAGPSCVSATRPMTDNRTATARNPQQHRSTTIMTVTYVGSDFAGAGTLDAATASGALYGFDESYSGKWLITNPFKSRRLDINGRVR